MSDTTETQEVEINGTRIRLMGRLPQDGDIGSRGSPRPRHFSTLFDLLTVDTSVGALASCIEKFGIYCWDRYGRFGPANEANTARALDLLAEAYTRRFAVETEQWIELAFTEEPIERPSLFDFGWFDDDIPTLEMIARDIEAESNKQGEPERKTPQRRGAETKSRDTLLTIIAALSEQAGIDPSGRGAAARIAEAVERIGATIGDDTVRAVLKEIPNAVDRRSK